MATRVAAAALLLPLLLVATCCHAQTASNTTQALTATAELVAMLKSALEPGPSEVLYQKELPKERAPFNSPWGYVMCDYSCMTNFATSVKTGKHTKGVLEVDVRYKPLKGVTSDMMVWLLNNDHKNVSFTGADGKVQNMPMHLLFHPVDHMFHTSSSTPMTVGTKLVWCEIPLTGCRYDQKSSTEPWVCPTNRTGFLQTTPKSTWGQLMQTKMQMTVTIFNSSMLEFAAYKSNPFFGNTSRVVGNTRHTWSDSPEGLQLRTQMWTGLMAPGSTTVFDTSFVAGLANPIIAKTYIGSPATNVPANNMTSIGYMAALHFLEEYGTLPRWLPKVYNSRKA